MSDDSKPPFDTHDDEDPFLIPPGQPGSLMDRLAAASTQRIITPRGSLVLVVPNDPAEEIIIVVGRAL